jgi:hypothetical protein
MVGAQLYEHIYIGFKIYMLFFFLKKKNRNFGNMYAQSNYNKVTYIEI